jgi:16S rRNA G527 N7-methylase RsmG
MEKKETTSNLVQVYKELLKKINKANNLAPAAAT